MAERESRLLCDSQGLPRLREISHQIAEAFFEIDALSGFSSARVHRHRHSKQITAYSARTQVSRGQSRPLFEADPNEAAARCHRRVYCAVVCPSLGVLLRTHSEVTL